MNYQHNTMNNTQGLDLFAAICGTVSGVASMLNIHPVHTLSFAGAMLVAAVMGASGWLGGFIAKEIAKHIKIQCRNFKKK
jgi:uncharacterized membrane protein YfcA